MIPDTYSLCIQAVSHVTLKLGERRMALASSPLPEAGSCPFWSPCFGAFLDYSTSPVCLCSFKFTQKNPNQFKLQALHQERVVWREAASRWRERDGGSGHPALPHSGSVTVTNRLLAISTLN